MWGDDHQPTPRECCHDRPCTVLILEPGLARRLIYRQILDARYRLIFAETALEALTIVARERPDLVLLPVRLTPDVTGDLGKRLDGVDLCRIVKRSPLRETPVILRGDGAGLLEALRARRAGADRYLPGPTTDEAVRAAIGELLSPVIVTARLRSRDYVCSRDTLTASRSITRETMGSAV